MRDKKYLQQLLIFCILLGFIPVVATGFFAYIKASEALHDNTRQTHFSLLRQAEMAVEHALSQVDYSVMQFVSQPSFQNVMNGDLDFRDFMIYNDITTSLANLPYANFNMNQILLINFYHDWIINQYGLSRYSDYQDKARIERYSALRSTSTWITTEFSEHDTQHEEIRTISLVKKFPLLTFSTQPRGLFVMDVSVYELNDLFPIASPTSSFVLLDSSHSVLSDRDGFLSDHARYAEVLRLLNELPEQTTEAELNLSEGFIATYLKSSYNQWSFMLIISTDELYESTRSIRILTIVVCLIIFVFTAFLAVWGSSRMYVPVRRLYEFIRPSMKEDQRVKDEFSMFEMHFKDLKQNGLQLQSRLNFNQPQLEELLVVKMLQGQLREKEIKEKLQDYRLIDTWDVLYVLSIQIDTLDGTEYDDMDLDLILFSIQNIVSEIIPASIRFMPVIIQQTIVTILALEKMHVEEMNQIAEKIQQAIRQYLKITVSIGISRPFQHLPESNKAYEESIEALRYRISLGHDMILFLDETSHLASEQPEYPEEKEKELLNAVRMQDKDWALQCLRAFLQEVVEHNSSHGAYQIMTGQLVFRLLELLPNYDELLQRYAESSLLKNLASLHSLQEAEKLLSEKLIIPIIDLLKSNRESTQYRITQAIIEIIQNEYDTHLSLDECADRLNFHPSYISKVFKKETGFSFSEYLAQYRLKISKEWLEETDLKMHEISERLKYNSSAAFIRYFRNMEGITPGEYRKRVQNKNARKGD